MTREFRLRRAQIRRDTDNKFENHINELLGMLDMLDNDKPTAVRQCMRALYLVVFIDRV